MACFSLGGRSDRDRRGSETSQEWFRLEMQLVTAEGVLSAEGERTVGALRFPHLPGRAPVPSILPGNSQGVFLTCPYCLLPSFIPPMMRSTQSLQGPGSPLGTQLLR